MKLTILQLEVTKQSLEAKIQLYEDAPEGPEQPFTEEEIEHIDEHLADVNKALLLIQSHENCQRALDALNHFRETLSGQHNHKKWQEATENTKTSIIIQSFTPLLAHFY